MRQYYSVLKDCTLFAGFDGETAFVLDALGARLRNFAKGESIRYPNAPVTEVGILVKGLAYITKTDYDGNRIILSEIIVGKTFGESLAFSGAQNSPIEIVAARDCTVIIIPADRIIGLTDQKGAQLKRNLIKLLAEKNMLLQIKNDILSQKTTREKLLLYLEYSSKTAGSKAFDICFSREDLADFLSINASAMSRELGKMRDEGIIKFRKNHFYLIDK